MNWALQAPCSQPFHAIVLGVHPPAKGPSLAYEPKERSGSSHNSQHKVWLGRSL